MNYVLVILAILIVALVLYAYTRCKPPMGWHMDIEQETINNQAWRNVVQTSGKLQVVLMSVPPGQELGWETHHFTDQFFRVEAGVGELRMRTKCGTKNIPLRDGVAAVVEQGVEHNVINTGEEPLKFYTIYSPPHHPHGLFQRVK